MQSTGNIKMNITQLSFKEKKRASTFSFYWALPLGTLLDVVRTQVGGQHLCEVRFIGKEF